MGAMYWIRVVLMVLTFGVVVWTIRYMNTAKPETSPIAQAILGETDGKITLCPTRVTSIDADGFRIVQEGMKWMRDVKGVKEEINGGAVEQWFALFCTSPAVKAETGAGFMPTLQLSYVSGEPAMLEHATTGEWRWKGQRYQSKALEDAMRTLIAIPSAKAPGQN